MRPLFIVSKKEPDAIQLVYMIIEFFWLKFCKILPADQIFPEIKTEVAFGDIAGCRLLIAEVPGEMKEPLHVSDP